MSKQDDQWECAPLDVETLLVQGEHLTYYIARALNWLDELP